VRRIPFTLALALTLFITATVTGTLLRAISAAELVRWGFSAADLAHGRWFHLFLATFQIFNPYLALSMLATVLALVGACEYRLGTGRTVLVYALSHVAGFLAIIVVAKIFAATGSRWGSLLVSEHNVGASAGAVGAMGAWLMTFPRPLRTWSIALCAAFLFAAFGGDVHPWDIAHVASFLVGLGMGAWFGRDGRFARARERFNARPGTQTDRRAALAWAGAIVGLFCVLAPFALVDGMQLAELLARVTPRGLELMRWLFFVTGLFLLSSTPALRRGEARAHTIAFAAGAVSCIALWQPGAPGVEHVLAILFVTGLVVWRHDFEAPPLPRSLRSAARSAAILVACALAFGLFGFVALREHFVPTLGREGSLHVALLRLRFQPTPVPNWYSPGATWFLEALPLVLYGAVLLTIPMFIPSGNPGNSRRAAGSSGRTAQSE
jgi:hypothetical protein